MVRLTVPGLCRVLRPVVLVQFVECRCALHSWYWPSGCGEAAPFTAQCPCWVAWPDPSFSFGRVCVDTSLEGNLGQCPLLGNFRETLQHGYLSRRCMMAFGVNVYNEGNLLSIVTPSCESGWHCGRVRSQCMTDVHSFIGRKMTSLSDRPKIPRNKQVHSLISDVHSFIHSFIHSRRSFIHFIYCSFIHSFQPFIRSFIPSVQTFIHSRHSFINSFIHSRR